VEDWAEIRRLYRSEKLSQAAIARQLALSRNTVAKAVHSAAPPRYERAAVTTSAWAQIELAVRALLGAYPTMPATVIAERVSWTGRHSCSPRTSHVSARSTPRLIRATVWCICPASRCSAICGSRVSWFLIMAESPREIRRHAHTDDWSLCVKVVGCRPFGERAASGGVRLPTTARSSLCTRLDAWSTTDTGASLHRLAGPIVYFSSKTRSSIGRVIVTVLPVTSTTASRPVVEWPVDRTKNLSAAWSRKAGKPATESSPRCR
jgi:hypothetical protein